MSSQLDDCVGPSMRPSTVCGGPRNIVAASKSSKGKAVISNYSFSIVSPSSSSSSSSSSSRPLFLCIIRWLCIALLAACATDGWLARFYHQEGAPYFQLPVVVVAAEGMDLRGGFGELNLNSTANGTAPAFPILLSHLPNLTGADADHPTPSNDSADRPTVAAAVGGSVSDIIFSSFHGFLRHISNGIAAVASTIVDPSQYGIAMGGRRSFESQASDSQGSLTVYPVTCPSSSQGTSQLDEFRFEWDDQSTMVAPASSSSTRSSLGPSAVEDVVHYSMSNCDRATALSVVLNLTNVPPVNASLARQTRYVISLSNIAFMRPNASVTIIGMHESRIATASPVSIYITDNDFTPSSGSMMLIRGSSSLVGVGMNGAAAPSFALPNGSTIVIRGNKFAPIIGTAPSYVNGNDALMGSLVFGALDGTPWNSSGLSIRLAHRSSFIITGNFFSATALNSNTSTYSVTNTHTHQKQLAVLYIGAASLAIDDSSSFVVANNTFSMTVVGEIQRDNPTIAFPSGIAAIRVDIGSDGFSMMSSASSNLPTELSSSSRLLRITNGSSFLIDGNSAFISAFIPQTALQCIVVAAAAADVSGQSLLSVSNNNVSLAIDAPQTPSATYWANTRSLSILVDNLLNISQQSTLFFANNFAAVNVQSGGSSLSLSLWPFYGGRCTAAKMALSDDALFLVKGNTIMAKFVRTGGISSVVAMAVGSVGVMEVTRASVMCIAENAIHLEANETRSPTALQIHVGAADVPFPPLVQTPTESFLSQYSSFLFERNTVTMLATALLPPMDSTQHPSIQLVAFNGTDPLRLGGSGGGPASSLSDTPRSVRINGFSSFIIRENVFSAEINFVSTGDTTISPQNIIALLSLRAIPTFVVDINASLVISQNNFSIGARGSMMRTSVQSLLGLVLPVALSLAYQPPHQSKITTAQFAFVDISGNAFLSLSNQFPLQCIAANHTVVSMVGAPPSSSTLVPVSAYDSSYYRSSASEMGGGGVSLFKGTMPVTDYNRWQGGVCLGGASAGFLANPVNGSRVESYYALLRSQGTLQYLGTDTLPPLDPSVNATVSTTASYSPFFSSMDGLLRLLKSQSRQQAADHPSGVAAVYVETNSNYDRTFSVPANESSCFTQFINFPLLRIRDNIMEVVVGNSTPVGAAASTSTVAVVGAYDPQCPMAAIVRLLEVANVAVDITGNEVRGGGFVPHFQINNITTAHLKSFRFSENRMTGAVGRVRPTVGVASSNNEGGFFQESDEKGGLGRILSRLFDAFGLILASSVSQELYLSSPLFDRFGSNESNRLLNSSDVIGVPQQNPRLEAAMMWLPRGLYRSSPMLFEDNVAVAEGPMDVANSSTLAAAMRSVYSVLKISEYVSFPLPRNGVSPPLVEFCNNEIFGAVQSVIHGPNTSIVPSGTNSNQPLSSTSSPSSGQLLNYTAAAYSLAASPNFTVCSSTTTPSLTMTVELPTLVVPATQSLFGTLRTPITPSPTVQLLTMTRRDLTRTHASTSLSGAVRDDKISSETSSGRSVSASPTVLVPQHRRTKSKSGLVPADFTTLPPTTSVAENTTARSSESSTVLAEVGGDDAKTSVGSISTVSTIVGDPMTMMQLDAVSSILELADCTDAVLTLNTTSSAYSVSNNPLHIFVGPEEGAADRGALVTFAIIVLGCAVGWAALHFLKSRDRPITAFVNVSIMITPVTFGLRFAVRSGFRLAFFSPYGYDVGIGIVCLLVGAAYLGHMLLALTVLRPAAVVCVRAPPPPLSLHPWHARLEQWMGPLDLWVVDDGGGGGAPGDTKARPSPGATPTPTPTDAARGALYAPAHTWLLRYLHYVSKAGGGLAWYGAAQLWAALALKALAAAATRSSCVGRNAAALVIVLAYVVSLLALRPRPLASVGKWAICVASNVLLLASSGVSLANAVQGEDSGEDDKDLLRAIIYLAYLNTALSAIGSAASFARTVVNKLPAVFNTTSYDAYDILAGAPAGATTSSLTMALLMDVDFIGNSRRAGSASAAFFTDANEGDDYVDRHMQQRPLLLPPSAEFDHDDDANHVGTSIPMTEVRALPIAVEMPQYPNAGDDGADYDFAAAAAERRRQRLTLEQQAVREILDHFEVYEVQQRQCGQWAVEAHSPTLHNGDVIAIEGNGGTEDGSGGALRSHCDPYKDPLL